MFDKLEILNLAQGMATHAAARQTVLARNIANADTPGYRSSDLGSFQDSYQDIQDTFQPRQTRAGHVVTSRSAEGLYPEHVLSGQESSPNGNSVSIETEMTKAAETRAQHDMALGVYKSALGILRSSLGR